MSVQKHYIQWICYSDKAQFGQVIDKEVATSFWKGKSSGVSIFGRSQANTSASDTKNPFGQRVSRDVKPILSVLNTPANIPSDQLLNPISESVDQQNSQLGRNLSNVSRSTASQKDFGSSPFPTTGEDHNEDENFHINFLAELCQKKIGRYRGKMVRDVTDVVGLQKKMTEIGDQMRNIETRLHAITMMPSIDSPLITSTPDPTSSELQKETQRETLLRLERNVAQSMNSPRDENMSFSRPTIAVTSQQFSNPNNGMSCADPMNLFRGLLQSSSSIGDCVNFTTHNDRNYGKCRNNCLPSHVSQNPLQRLERLARHPGHTGLCLGCMDDDAQDRALRILKQLAVDWNTICDSDSE
ncbi:hypothetical protein KIN20_010876 [Parelaphostrongylus tenuis]|uniref:Uncharacterized protein n=1 Tax=Parelaphostrongylus tenuis TaxID=148309 RepID=A0AAD5MR76_PARTN|nr:hypothetical protein KIN20_010876 [Parelaphostrongylus tenuis]